jgi:hypothetical protein
VPEDINRDSLINGTGYFQLLVSAFKNCEPASLQLIDIHTGIDKCDDIPPEYIAEVKKMWLSYPNESNALGILKELDLFQRANATFQVSTKAYLVGGRPKSHKTAHLSSDIWRNIFGNTYK